MYTTAGPRVRDEPAAYGPHEVDGDEFPAARVLKDLAGAADEDIPRILARYAALRSWLLRRNAAEVDLIEHAESTAHAYLAAVEDWPEAESLARLVDDEPELSVLWHAAANADLDGHTESGYALLRAGYMAARRRADLPWAARMAEAITELLDDAGLDGVTVWVRRADRLRKRLDGA